MIPLLGFTPDIDPLTPGCIVDATNIIPTERGIAACPTAVTAGPSAMPAECRGAALLRNLSGTNRLVAGTAANLYDANSTAWGTVSSASAGYTLGTDDRWSFCQFGNSAIAATISTKIERSSSGAFTVITAAPKAQIVESVKGFVMACHTNETAYGDSTDRWWCSAYLDETDWTPSVATQCTTGRLVEGGGPITAAKRLGDDIVVYKRRAMFLGRYSGAPVVWDFIQVSSDIGCVGQEAVVNTGSAHIFTSENNVYLYDGVRPVSIADGQVREWYTDRLNPSYNFRTRILWDRRRNLAWIFFCSTNSTGTPDKGLVWYAPKQRWGVIDQNVEAVVNYVTPAFTYDGGSNLVTTYDTGPATPFDSPTWISAAENGAIFNSSHVMSTLSGVAGTTSFTTGDYGDEDAYTFCTRLQVRFLDTPSSSTATGYTKDDEGEALTATSTAALDDNAFDLRQNARFHRYKVEMVGTAEATALRPRLTPAGRR